MSWFLSFCSMANTDPGSPKPPPPKKKCESEPSTNNEGKVLPLGILVPRPYLPLAVDPRTVQKRSEKAWWICNTGVTFCHAYTAVRSLHFIFMLRCKPFHSIFTESPFFCISTIADSAIISFHRQQIIFDSTYLQLEASHQHQMKSNIQLRLVDATYPRIKKTLGSRTSLVLEQLQTWTRIYVERL